MVGWLASYRSLCHSGARSVLACRLRCRVQGDGEAIDWRALQCHMGLDTLSWARRGALVSGLDFSAPAIEAASSLAAELGLAARARAGAHHGGESRHGLGEIITALADAGWPVLNAGPS
jgi:hypothetical protein